MEENNANIGILTFHCSDNFGAMLQAYGLKSCLCLQNMPAEIIRYEPFFMTGRHWFIPYVPREGSNGHKWRGCNIWMTLCGMKANLAKGKNYWKRHANMKRFRKEYLIGKKSRKILFLRTLRSLPFQYYVVGSDQIWNPEITCGLREAYFGAFENKNKKKVISYAASIGGTEIGAQYDEEFSRLIQYIDIASVREESAIPYVKKFYERDIEAVIDPVFLPGREAFQKIEKRPERPPYILVYITEKDPELCEYVRKLAQEKKLSVVEVCAGNMTTGAGFEVDYTAGPSEFLGYIHEADYVVSNSFHAISFSIIYEKQFLAFLHSSRGARSRNVLQIHGLEDRICKSGAETNIDAFIDWKEVARRTEKKVIAAREFLLKSLADGTASETK